MLGRIARNRDLAEAETMFAVARDPAKHPQRLARQAWHGGRSRGAFQR